MTNTEIITALRCCGSPDTICKGLCPYNGVEYCSSKKDLDAADALEAAEKRIARLEEDLKTREAEREVMQDTIKVCEKRIAELEAQAETLKEESEAYKFGYLDGKTESDRQIEDLQTALTACRLRKDEEQLPKEGEWIYEDLDNFRKYKVTCPHCGAWYIGNYDAYDEPSDFNYCPHCGNICNQANLAWEKELSERERKENADADN